MDRVFDDDGTTVAGEPPVVRRATATDAAAIAEVWLASFTAALPTVRRAHSDDEVHGWVRDTLLPEAQVWVADDDAQIVAMMAIDSRDIADGPGELAQLYVLPDHLGRGIGGRLLAIAQNASPAGLSLWTFQVNTRARGFYVHHGFHEVELTDGAGNEEREPDVRLVWLPEA
ncbi:GNAT family N-acetyltransferase [Leifsonia sp. Leaf264]|uniref:GNAT family N-acetyltransferase n=1 Tax=Leifsonia sp. Leaf264 TaxID=1736314 RepID=UPI0006F1FBE8|nr:GNAT family N-acetyltransferase [Leifsonia sp. Leaf264]KQP01148.1 hypothetical protein ASF30_00435 [Leifsonia sp. Leaf264]